MNQLKILMAMLMLSLTACSGLSKVNEEIKSIAYHVKTLKEKGCAAVPKPALRLLVVLIKSRIDNYPENGVCDKNWVRDVLVNKIDLLESDDGFQNRPAPVGHQTDSGYTNLVQPSAAVLLFQKHPAASYSTEKLQNRFSLNSKTIPLVYASSVIRNQSRCRHTRFYLHGFMQIHHQKTS